MDRFARRGASATTAPSARTTCSNAWSTRRGARVVICRSSRRPNTSARSRRSSGQRVPGRRDDGMAHPLADSLERDGDGDARIRNARRTRWPHRRPSPRRRRCTTSVSTISGAAPSDEPIRVDLILHQGHSSQRPASMPSARSSKAASAKSSSTCSVMRGRGPGPRTVIVSASVAHARLLAGADRLDGPPGRSRRSIQAHFWKYLEKAAASFRSRRAARSWCLIGDGGSRTSPNRRARCDLARGPRGSSTTSSSSSTATCSASSGPVRGQRQDHPGTREGVFRGAGWNVIKIVWGQLLGPAARRAIRTARCASS